MQVNEPASDRTARETPRLYVRQEDRYEDLSSSASAFLIVGIVMSVLTLLSFGQQLHLPFALPTTALMRFFLLIFAIGAFGLYWKTRREASRITEELESWFLASYAPEQIDLEILGATRHPLRAEALALKRFDFIQDCFLQRYDGMDEGYIEALSEELYKKLFESGHYGKAVLKKADAAVSEEQRSETAPHNAAPQDMAQASEEMQPADAVQSAEIPETVTYNAEPQDMTQGADAPLPVKMTQTAELPETVAYNTEPQDMTQVNEVTQTAEAAQAEAVPSEHEAETADSAETLSAVVSATEDAAAASAETEAAARDEAPVE